MENQSVTTHNPPTVIAKKMRAMQVLIPREANSTKHTGRRRDAFENGRRRRRPVERACLSDNVDVRRVVEDPHSRRPWHANRRKIACQKYASRFFMHA